MFYAFSQIAFTVLFIQISINSFFCSITGKETLKDGISIATDVRFEQLETKTNWVGLEKIHFKDQAGTQRTWEYAYRKFPKRPEIPKDQAESVAVFATVSGPKLPPSTIIILQYRGPVNKIVVELPAGLINPGESPEKAALRELLEETGFGNESDGGHASVEDSSSLLAIDPGMTSSRMHLVSVSVKIPDGINGIPRPKQELDDGEHIEVKLVPLHDLPKTLEDHSKLPNHVIDARLASLALGVSSMARHREGSQA